MSARPQGTRSKTKTTSADGRQLFDALSQMPFVDSSELPGILGEPHATVHRALTRLLSNGMAGRVRHGTAHMPSSQRYYLTAHGIREAAQVLDFDTPSDFVRAYPVSREWLALLIRRMDSVAVVYRLAASLSSGIDRLESRVEFHRRGRFDATITLHDGRSFGMVRQGLALRRRSLYDRLRGIVEYDYTRRSGTVLILTPSAWEQRLTTRFCMELNLEDSYVGLESRDTLERRDLRVWQKTSGLFSGSYYTLDFVSSQGDASRRLFTESPNRKRASMPRPERMVQSAPTFGISPSEKQTLNLIADHPMIPRDHLARWLGVSEGRVSQMVHSLVNTWGLVKRRGKRGDTRYTLSAEGIRYITHRDRAQLPTTRGIWGALRNVYPQAAEQRCWNHKIVNVLAKLPKRQQDQAKLMLRTIPYAPTRTEAERLRTVFTRWCGDHSYEAASEALERDWDRMVTFYDFPKEHWGHLRTTNPVESPFAALRLRTDAAKRYKRVDRAIAVIWKMLMVAEQRFRRLKAPELIQDVYLGAQYADGIAIESTAEKVAA